jgi:ribose transport system substrate-binding protein
MDRERFIMKYFVMALAACIGMIGCTSEAPTTAGRAGGEGAYTIAVIPKGLSHQFWTTVKAGAEAAADEMGATVIWNGPEKETEVAKQISIVEDMVSRRVDGIVMAACDADALIDVVERAQNRGIPVVTIDSGVNSDAPVTFVATDNVAGARAAAEKLVELIGGSGDVGLLPFVPGAATSDLREQGFKEGIADHPEVRLAVTLHSYSDVARGMNAVEDMLASHPELKGIFAANEPGAIGAVEAVRAADKAGQVKLVAFDASENELAALERGDIQALIVQNPFQMGYLGVKAAIDAIEGRPVDKRIDTGVTVVTQENLNDPDVQELLNPQN